MTRLLSAAVSGFRAFSGEHSFDLDADVVILSGPNGSGKTSLFDSILWGLSGSLPRFSGHKAQAISLYSPSGTARVELTFAHRDGRIIKIVRSASSEEHSDVIVELEQRRLEGAAAVAGIYELFWPSSLQTSEPLSAFCTAFTRSVYLQQDLVRQFIESDSEDTRYTVMSELVGAGRLNEFLRELEASRNAWSRSRTQRETELEEARSRAAQIRQRLERLREKGLGLDLGASWDEWWQAATASGVADAAPAFDAATAGHTLNDALSMLQAHRRVLERRRDQIQVLLEEWRANLERAPEDTTPLDELRKRHDEQSAHLAAVRKELEAAQGDAALEREHLTQQKETQEELRALAALALRHLGEECPVCAQPYDIEGTRARLETLVSQAPTDAVLTMSQRVTELNRNITEIEESVTSMTAEIAATTRLVSEGRVWRESLPQRLADVELPHESTPDTIGEALLATQDQIEALGAMYAKGENLALAVASQAEAAQRAELEHQLTGAEELVESRAAVLARHESAGDVASSILEATRKAARESVDARVQRIEPLVERIYARMDPHPAFTDISLATSYPRGHGRIRPLVADPSAGLTDRDPYSLFSSSQLNALAVSLFLGLNLGASSAPLQAVMLDDPLQSLDDVNLLGLVDTLRRTKAMRQLLVSTHDRRLTSLLQRKLRPVGEDRGTLVYTFSDWNEQGPSVDAHELEVEPTEFRMAVA